MDKPNLDYNTGKENVELEELCFFVLLACKKTESKCNTNHVRKSKVLLITFLKKNIMFDFTKVKQVSKIWQWKSDYPRKCISGDMLYPWNCISWLLKKETEFLQSIDSLANIIIEVRCFEETFAQSPKL